MFPPPPLPLFSTLNPDIESFFPKRVPLLRQHAVVILLSSLVGAFGVGVPALAMAQEEIEVDGEGATPHVEPWERIIYFVITDRFANGNIENDGPEVDESAVGAFHGGDFSGLTSKVPYLAQLGVNTVWITPIVEQIDHPVGDEFEHWPFHGYWAEHFDRLEPRLGTAAELHAFLSTAHDADIQVIADVVLNHPGYGSHFSVDPTWTRSVSTESCPPSGQSDLTECLFGLPDFRTEVPVVAQSIIDWQSAWFAEFAFDGLRADTVKHVELSVWEDFLAAVRTGQESFFAVGEWWGTTPRIDEPLLEPGLFDALFDFDFHQYVESFMNGRLRAEALTHHLSVRNDAAVGRYVHFLNTHDTSTLVSLLDDEDAYGLALTMLMTSSGIPMLYYGDELGRRGGEWPDNRPSMMWADVEGDGASVLELTRDLIQLRAENPALARGLYETLDAGDGLVVFSRADEFDQVVVGWNRGPDVATVSCEAAEDGCQVLFCHRCQAQQGFIELEPYGAVVLD